MLQKKAEWTDSNQTYMTPEHLVAIHSSQMHQMQNWQPRRVQYSHCNLDCFYTYYQKHTINIICFSYPQRFSYVGGYSL